MRCAAHFDDKHVGVSDRILGPPAIASASCYPAFGSSKHRLCSALSSASASTKLLKKL